MSMSPYIHSEQIREATFALIQMSCGTDPNKNRGKAVAKIRMAAEQGAQVMVLQELFASQYFCFTEDYDLSKSYSLLINFHIHQHFQEIYLQNYL